MDTNFEPYTDVRVTGPDDDGVYTYTQKRNLLFDEGRCVKAQYLDAWKKCAKPMYGEVLALPIKTAAHMTVIKNPAVILKSFDIVDDDWVFKIKFVLPQTDASTAAALRVGFRILSFCDDDKEVFLIAADMHLSPSV